MKITARLYDIVTFLMVVSLLFSYRVNSLCIILLSVTWLLEGGFPAKFRSLIREPFFLLNVILFLLYLLSVTQSADKPVAWFFVEKNLSLLVLPMVLLSKKRFTDGRLYTFCTAFIAGILLLMSFATIRALAAYFQEHDYQVFFYHQLAGQAGLSAIIASLLCIVAFALLLYVPLSPALKRITGAVLALWLVLLSSKLFLALLLLILVLHVSGRVGSRLRWGVLLSLAALLLLVLFTHNPLKKRFEDIGQFRSAYLSESSFNEGIYFDGLSLRLVFIRFGLEIMKEERQYWLGVGTGDAEALLRRKIKAYHMYTGNGLDDKEGYLQYGYHNELLQKWIQLGFSGLLVFLAIMGYLCYMAFRHRDHLLGNLLLVYTGSFFTDTLLEQQVGLVIFLTFTCFAINRIRNGTVGAKEGSLKEEGSNILY